MSINNFAWFLICCITACAKPMASYVVHSSETIVPAKVTFENTSTKGKKYLWDFGDGNTSTEYSPIHRYLTSGKYKVKLSAQNGRRKSELVKEIFFNAPNDCLVNIETNFGSILIKLYDETPLHRDNFLKLVESNFYEGILFHRVINGFMIQAGDPNSKNATKNTTLGAGEIGYTLPSEFRPGLVHVKGSIAAARMSDHVNPEKASSGCQFYIVHGRPVSEDQLEIYENIKSIKYTEEQKKIMTTVGGTPQLDKEYTVFGEVIQGLDIIDKVASTSTDGTDRPIIDIKIIKTKIIK
jgi:peptidyl-prolyl cis-trans isomerase B (cyclophilin B)